MSWRNNRGGGPVKICQIAQAQAIPKRFLEVILSQLKNSGFVKSKRGYQGGYVLVPSPSELTVGDLMRYLQKDSDTAKCMAPIPEAKCPFRGGCAFATMWKRVNEAIFHVYDDTSIQDLLNDHDRMGEYPS